MKRINASDFKARCLALLDEVKETGEGLTILKHGKPVAQVLPLDEPEEAYPQHLLRGTVTIVGDVLGTGEQWEAETTS